MITDKVYSESVVSSFSLKDKLRDYGQLVKFRLNMTVVLSTFIGFLLGSSGNIHWTGLVVVVVGGFLTVGAANGINQIIERDSDKLMRRTENRPLASNRMGVTEATIACLIMGIAGVSMIGLYLNQLAGMLSFISLCLYGFVYTPMKKVSPVAVYVGAIPGALPPIIGFVAAAGGLGMYGWTLFILQFIWQFPHFYSIAWLLDEDYKRAGLKMMPIGTTKDKKAAFQIVIFSLAMIPAGLLPYFLGCAHLIASILVAVCGGGLAWQSIVLYKDLSNKSAKKLMFFSIMYLPVIFLIMLIDKMLM
jgi:protoheme IX farnesyltransferase